MIYLTRPKHKAASKRRQRKAKEGDKRFNKKEGTTNAREQNVVYSTWPVVCSIGQRGIASLRNEQRMSSRVLVINDDSSILELFKLLLEPD